jgi:hypothetical protein
VRVRVGEGGLGSGRVRAESVCRRRPPSGSSTWTSSWYAVFGARSIALPANSGRGAASSAGLRITDGSARTIGRPLRHSPSPSRRTRSVALASPSASPLIGTRTPSETSVGRSSSAAPTVIGACAAAGGPARRDATSAPPTTASRITTASWHRGGSHRPFAPRSRTGIGSAQRMFRLATLAPVPVLVALVAGVPAAGAHQPDGLTAAERHRAADLADVSVTALERRAAAVARRLGRRPGTRPARARQAAVGDAGLVGRWSSVLAAPVIPIFEALLPNGKVLMWDSVGDNPTESYTNHTFTRAAVYDPATNTSKRVDVSGYNIFCAGFVQLANGNVFVAGGNLDRNLAGIRQTHVFDWRTETWSRGPDMQDGRWYPSVASLPNEEAVVVGGGPTVAEVRTSTGGLRRLTGFATPASREYPFLQAGPDGRAAVLGPAPAMSLLDTHGAGAFAGFGNRDAIHRGYGSYAPYDTGRVLVAGGGSVSEDGRSGVPTRTASVVDLRSGAPVGRATGSMTLRRRQHNLTTLADGSVLATGGQSTNGGGGLVDLANAVYAAERWDPATERWTEMANAAVARQYHSTALLLPDGRVLTGGGGICGACHQVGYLRRDQEIFSPPYLFRKDGSGQLAARPVLSGAPATVRYDTTFTVSSPQAAGVRKLALVRLGAPTHSQDQSQRYVPLPFTAAGTTLTVTASQNPNEAPPGPYMLFAVDAAGVPSVAPIVTVQRPAAPAPPAATNLALNRPATGSAPCTSTEGPAKAFNGSVSGGLSDKWCSLVAGTRVLTVDLGAARSVTSFTARHAGAGGESASMNTRDFRILTSTDNATWSTAVTVTGNTANVTTRSVAARSARWVRLEITDSEQGTAAGAARIYEFEVYGAAPAFTAPAPFVAYSGLGATGRAQRFEAGRYDAARGSLGLVGNNATRSVDVSTGYTATICKNTGLADCTTLGAGRTSPLPAGFDLTMSSVRVVRVP